MNVYALDMYGRPVGADYAGGAYRAMIFTGTAADTGGFVDDRSKMRAGRVAYRRHRFRSGRTMALAVAALLSGRGRDACFKIDLGRTDFSRTLFSGVETDNCAGGADIAAGRAVGTAPAVGIIRHWVHERLDVGRGFQHTFGT